MGVLIIWSSRASCYETKDMSLSIRVTSSKIKMEDKLKRHQQPHSLQMVELLIDILLIIS